MRAAAHPTLRASRVGRNAAAMIPILVRPALTRAALLSALATAVAVALVACGGGDAGDGDDGTGGEPVNQAPIEEQAPVEPVPVEPAPAPEDEPAVEEAPPVEEEPVVVPDAEREVLVYGDSLEGEITVAGEERQFRFDGTENDLVRIIVDGKDGMDPIATLLEPNRTEIAANDDLGTSNRDSLIIARLPTTGLQVIRVGAYGESIGRYVVRLELLPEDDDADDRILRLGDAWAGTFWAPGDIDTFEFAGTAGQTVRVRVDGAIGVDTKMELFTPDGNFLTSDDDSGHGLDAEIALELPVTGAYRVQASAVGNRIGEYTFSAEELGEPTPGLASDLEAIEAVGLTYLAALQGADSLALFALAGPEALAIRGWESPEDVSRDIDKLQSIGLAGTQGEITSVIEEERGRVAIELDTGGTEPDTVRFDLTNVNGQWLVDFVQRFFVAAEDPAA